MGSCCNMLLSSFSLIVSCDEMHSVQIFIVLCMASLTAITWSLVLRLILL